MSSGTRPALRRENVDMYNGDTMDEKVAAGESRRKRASTAKVISVRGSESECSRSPLNDSSLFGLHAKPHSSARASLCSPLQSPKEFEPDVEKTKLEFQRLIWVKV